MRVCSPQGVRYYLRRYSVIWDEMTVEFNWCKGARASTEERYLVQDSMREGCQSWGRRLQAGGSVSIRLASVLPVIPIALAGEACSRGFCRSAHLRLTTDSFRE